LANIGNLYFATNKPQAALGYYKEAAGEFEKNPLYLILIARTFLVLNEPDRARKVITSAEENLRGLKTYERDEEKGLGYYLLGHCFAALGEEDKVLKYVEMALKANPDRFVPRVGKESHDHQSLFYTMKDHPDLRKLLDKYASGLSPGRWFDQD
jgi:tetratricopeptide (TPR) repeat protein